MNYADLAQAPAAREALASAGGVQVADFGYANYQDLGQALGAEDYFDRPARVGAVAVNAITHGLSDYFNITHSYRYQGSLYDEYRNGFGRLSAVTDTLALEGIGAAFKAAEAIGAARAGEGAFVGSVESIGVKQMRAVEEPFLSFVPPAPRAFFIGS